MWSNGREDTRQIPYSKVLNVFPGVYALPHLQSHVHAAQCVKAAQCGGAETEEGTWSSDSEHLTEGFKVPL